jgi:D-arabinose 1-dehydrogenase-like Zn-dependent alcohol dehydrogenase
VRAARFVGPNEPLAVEDLADQQPGRDELLVRVEATGICASDLHFIHGEMPLPAAPPITMGHEASGVVQAAGADVPVWEAGDRVSLAAGKACMTCPACASGRLEDCRNPQIMGIHYDGTWAQTVLVPWYAAARLPDQVSFEHGAIACDAVATPYAALVDRGALRPGERVGIWGIGGLGTHAVQIARLSGASFICAVDPLEPARDRATALGADLVLDPNDDVPNAIRDALHGEGLDLAVDCIGRARVVQQGLRSLTSGGRLVVVGQSMQTLTAGPILLVSYLGLSILGHLGYRKRHLEDVLSLIASGRLDLSASVSAVLPLDAVNDGVRRLTEKSESTVRVLLKPNP